MRIVFDCRSVHPGMGGVGRTASCLARALPAALGRHELTLLWGSSGPLEGIRQARAVRFVSVAASMVDPKFEQLRLPALLAELGADLYHNPCFALPIEGDRVRKIATVHDVAFRRHPGLMESSIRSYFDHWTDVSCRVADAIVTPSAFTRAELAACYDTPESLVEVVPNAVDAAFSRVRRRRNAAAPFVLYVGCIEEKKNVLALVRGFAALLRRRPGLPHRLVLAGGTADGVERDLASLAGEARVAGRVVQTGYVEEARLYRLYGAADAFCYLSEYEGFGLPPLEAMAAGAPTLVSDRGALPGTTADAALHVDPHDADAVAAALERLLLDRPLRRSLARRGRQRATGWTWAMSARQLVRLYEAVLAREHARQQKLPIPAAPPEAW